MGASPQTPSPQRRCAPHGQTRQGRLARAAGFAKHIHWMYCLGACTLAIVSACIGNSGQDLKTSIKPGRIDNAPSALAGGLHFALGGLGVDTRQTHAATLTPRTGNHALGAPEAQDHPARAAAGHTLPRSMRPLGHIVAVSVAVIARHAGVETSVSPRR